MTKLVKKRSLIFLFFFFSLLISLFFKENSSGGAQIDFEITRQFVENFKLGFLHGLNYFIGTSQLQSPFYFIIIAYLEKIFNLQIIQLSYVIISSFLPIIFYSILKKRYNSVNNKNYLFYIACLLFLSPYFRSSSSWLTNDNLALIFFSLSISKFLNTEKNKLIFKNFFYCFFYLFIASYIRQYYIIFFFLYLFEATKKLKIDQLFKLIIFCILLSLPGIFYITLFIEKYNFLSAKELKPNYISNLYIYLSIIFFYLFPFFFNKKGIFSVKEFILNNKIFNVFLIIIFIISCKYFTYSTINELGGGAIYKISKAINTYQFFFIICYISLLIILTNIDFNKKNFVIYLSLYLAFPFSIIYQKYYDPLILIVFFGLLNQNSVKKLILNKLFKMNLLYSYYLFLYLFFIFYYGYSNKLI
jgi:hypothetical protein